MVTVGICFLEVQKKGGRSASWRVQDVLNKMPKDGNGGGSCKGETWDAQPENQPSMRERDGL